VSTSDSNRPDFDECKSSAVTVMTPLRVEVKDEMVPIMLRRARKCSVTAGAPESGERHRICWVCSSKTALRVNTNSDGVMASFRAAKCPEASSSIASSRAVPFESDASSAHELSGNVFEHNVKNVFCGRFVISDEGIGK
jgi:hypothetical protein